MPAQVQRFVAVGQRRELPGGMALTPVAGVIICTWRAAGRPRAAWLAATVPLGVWLNGGAGEGWYAVPFWARLWWGTLIAMLAAGARGLFGGMPKEVGMEPSDSRDTRLPRPTGNSQSSVTMQMLERAAHMLQELPGLNTVVAAISSVARAEATVGPATTQGAYTVVPLSEVVFAGGFGLGRSVGTSAGSETATPTVGGGGGGGGGGLGRGRAVAVVAIGPEGVTVKPVIDVTSLALAGLATTAAVAMALMRLRRSR